jgi:hypothetical protein
MNRGVRTPLSAVLAAWSAIALPALAEEPRAPIVTAIHPSGNEVPANHLKFYIRFSRPMRQGVFLQYCSLHDDRGEEVSEPFRETELWSDDRMRLTLWFHPGRQKTGVNLNEEFGPVLRAGQKYSLRISGRWPSEDGIALGKDFRKSFRTLPRATAQLDANVWRIAPPPAASTAPLTLRFPAPLDYALLLRCIRVLDANGKPLAGIVAVGEREQSWSFSPTHPWDSCEHTLAIDPILEDLAGNSLARPFELDLTRLAPRKPPAVVMLHFHPTSVSK